MHHSEDSSHISQRLEVGRKALETMASIAAQLENARDGLVRSAYLTTNIEDLPPAIRRMWESLDKNIVAMPANELERELQQIEQHLSLRLIWLTPFIEKICADETVKDEVRIRDVKLQLQDFAKLAGTALAIRILAHRKQFKFRECELPIRADALRQKAEHVKKIERTHKLRVINQMRDMMKATTDMLKSPQLNSATYAMLKSVLNDLQLNAKHLANGGSFSSLPVPIEEVEMMEQDNVDDSAPAELSLVEEKEAAPATSAPAPNPPAKNDKDQSDSRTPNLASPKPVVAPQVRPVPTRAQLPPVPPKKIMHQPVAPKTPSARNPMLKFANQFGVWIKSPLNVSWREAGLIVSEEDYE